MVRIIGALSGPIAERRAKSMHGEVAAAHALQRLQHCHVRQTAAPARANEYERVAMLSSQALEKLMRAIAQWYAMLFAALDAPGRHHPSLRLEVDLIPPCPDHLTRSRRRQNRELERPRGDTPARRELSHEIRQLAVGERRVMICFLNLPAGRQNLSEMTPPPRRIVARAIAAHGRPVYDSLHPASPTAGRLA